MNSSVNTSVTETSNLTTSLTLDGSHDFGLEVSRVTVNTHTSLLNITEDDDEDDEIEDIAGRSFLLDLDDDEFERTVTPPACCADEMVVRNESGTTMLDQMAEQFVDTLCYRHNSKEKQLDPDDPDDLLWEGYRSLVEDDVLELLNWMTLPSDQELDFLWRSTQGFHGLFCLKPDSSASPLSTTASKGPQRLSLRKRAMKIRRLREEHSFSPVSVRETRSFGFEQKIGVGMEAIPSGYDSDPEESFGFSPVPSPAPPLDTSDLQHLVQETLNLTWDLTWHVPHQAPIPVQAWLERGAMLPRKMIEPCLMWRRTSRHTKAAATSEPISIRLLNLCRVLPPGASLDRKAYPFVRNSQCIVLRTADENDEYVLTCHDRDNVLERWKHVVARFATLAVMEDIQTIQKEFFRLVPNAQMLVPDYERDLPHV